MATQSYPKVTLEITALVKRPEGIRPVALVPAFPPELPGWEKARQPSTDRLRTMLKRGMRRVK